MRHSLRVLITGGNTGIGKAIAKKLLMEGHKVVITARDEYKATQAVSDLKNQTNSQTIDFIVADLSNVKSVYELSSLVKSRYSDIQVLINNAGVWMSSLVLNTDGLEQSFMVNHVASYLLAKELIPTLKSNAPARIINVNAGLYAKGSINLQRTPVGLDFSSIKTYATTKLCSVLVTFSLAKELEGTGVTINAVHPGVINTGLGDSPGFMSRILKFVKRFWKSPNQGADAPAWLATSDEVTNLNGCYFDERKIHQPVDAALDEKMQTQLRELTDRLIETALR